MGVRFNKRIKVLPYVTANVGKSGVSLTIGPKGKTLNIGATGVNVNVSLGKGVGYSKRLITWKKLNILSWLGIGGAAATKAAKATKGKAKGKKGTTTDNSAISLDDALAEAETTNPNTTNGSVVGGTSADTSTTAATNDLSSLQEQAGCGPVGCILGILAVIIIIGLAAAVVYLLMTRPA